MQPDPYDFEAPAYTTTSTLVARMFGRCDARDRVDLIMGFLDAGASALKEVEGPRHASARLYALADHLATATH